MSNANMIGKRILVFGAHPDDIEFGCGAYLLLAKEQGATIDSVVLSKGEAGTYGDPRTREAEVRAAAEMLGAVVHFPVSPGDTRIRADLDSTLQAAKLIRSIQPHMILAPTGNRDQHPDHREVSFIVRDANRLARYGKTPGLEGTQPHATRLLLFYEISSEALRSEGFQPFVVDVSEQVDRWRQLMECHESQTRNLDYVDLQLSRARALGIQMGVQSALRFYSEGSLLVCDLSVLRSARL